MKKLKLFKFYLKRKTKLFSLFLLLKANLFSPNNSFNDLFKIIRNFVNIERSLARSLVRYILVKSFAIFVINKIDRNEDSSVSLIEIRSYYRVKS